MFTVCNGVKQGGVMSPLLFTLYMDNLITNITKADVGCYVGNICSCIFVYADDVILLAPTRKSMQLLLDKCEQFGEEFGLSYNPDKCETVVFGKCLNVRLKLCDKNLKMVRKVKHLGHTLSNTRYMFDIKPLISDMKTRTNVILSQFRFLSADSRIKIFNTNCTSFYGCNLTNLQMNDMKDLDRAWRVCSRRILGVHERTHCNLIPPLMSTLAPSLEIFKRMLSFFYQWICSFICNDIILF